MDFGFLGKVFGIRMVIFWGVRKLEKIDWRPLSLINPICYLVSDKVGSRDASASKKHIGLINIFITNHT